MSAYARKFAVAAIVIVAAFSTYSMSTVQNATAQSTLTSTEYFPDGYVNQAASTEPLPPQF